MIEGERPLDWYLEGVLADGKPWIIAITPVPFTVGRNVNRNLCLAANSVSRDHAVLDVRDGRLLVRDLQSTNGTFVNRQRIAEEEVPLAQGDVVHFGTAEFRVWTSQPESESDQTLSCDLLALGLPNHFLASEREMRALLARRLVRHLLQPIVNLQCGTRHGYEIMGRGNHPPLPTHPQELFVIAEALGCATHLSRLFWEEGLNVCTGLPGNPSLYINVHPAEMECPTLIPALRRYREANPRTPVILEVSERFVSNLGIMTKMRRELVGLGMELAYDDFGAGQARFLELVEVPPHVLKFDISLVKDIHERTGRHQQLVAKLVQMASELGISCLAEGVECQEERDVCAGLGFHYAQGFFFGRPSEAASACA
ncbi:MAG: EAL domain-containing protein [Acidobacteriota bacterium]